MSVDFASEALRCQRISSITPQITFDQGVIGGFSQGALGARLVRAATGRPKCPNRNIQIRPRNHSGFYWREIMTQEHQGMTAWAAVTPNHDGWEAVTPWTSVELSFELLAFVSKMHEVRAVPARHVRLADLIRAVAQLGRAPGSGKVSADFASIPLSPW